MINVYVYVFDTLADWEIGYVTAELNSRRYFKKDAPELTVKTVGRTKDSVKTMGGLTIVPDCVIEDMIVNNENVLVLPGGNTWNDPLQQAILAKAVEFMNAGGLVCAICGATIALAKMGLLNNRFHTSNGVGYIDMFCATYTGKEYYVNKPAVVDKNLITASVTGGLMFAKEIIKYLGVFDEEVIEPWYEFFSTGSVAAFYKVMKSLKK